MMAQSDSNDQPDYEFDAPSHVIDLKSLDNTADNADHWFDEAVGGNDFTPLRNNDKPLAVTQKANLPWAIVTPCQKEDPAPTASPPPNIVTSWGNRGPTQMGARPKRSAAQPPVQPPAQPRRVSKRKVAVSEEPTTVQVTPPVKKSRVSSTKQHVRRSNGNVRRSNGNVRRSNGNVRRSSGNVRRSVPKARAAATSTTHHNSSEEQELERIRALHKEVAVQRKKNEASYKAAMAGDPPPKKLVLCTTVPKEFNFSTDSRAKAGTLANPYYKEVDFTTQLRKHGSPSKAPKATVSKPFNLSTGNKRKVEGSDAYVSIAQQVEQFQKRTPERYHLRSRKNQERGPSPLKGEHLKTTIPHTPQLMTRQRTRATTAKSSAEIEAEEVDQLHKFKFKALELNRKILESALNPKKPAAKESTKIEAFQLHIEKRLQERQATKKPDETEKQPTFHSQPIPSRILEGVVGVPMRKVIHATIPESPAFALKNRVRMDRKVEEVKLPSPIKANPVPHFGLPFQPRLQLTQVAVCPFSFEEREQERRVLKEKRLDGMRNEEVPKFKAQLLPNFHEVVGLPEKKVTEPTKPEPFRMLVDQRGAIKNDRWELMRKEEQKLQMEAASFKAGPNTVIHKEPFQPKKENRTLEAINHSIVPEAFQLSTERRAKEREEYDKAVSETQALRAQIQEDQQHQQDREEEVERTRLRHEQVHKAQPIRRYKRVEVKKSDTVLTVPHSPNFSKRFD